jgi:hypothetical protein
LVSQSSKGVFLSYASEDTEIAQRIADALTAAGIDVWFDKSELRGGDAWDQKIRQQIQDCALFVPVISAHTQARPEGYFRLEWKLAVDRSHLMAAEKAFMVPVVVDATTEPEALVPAQFRAVQWTRLPQGVVPAAFVTRIAALIQQPISQLAGSNTASATRTATRSRSAALAALVIVAVAGILVAFLMQRGPGRSTAATAAKETAPASGNETAGAIPERSVAGKSDPISVAQALVVVGQRDEAFRWLEKASNTKAPGISSIKGNQYLQSLWNDPRWVRLCRELKLPQ